MALTFLRWLPLARLLIKSFDHFCGRPDGYRGRWDVFSDDGIGSDDGTVADRYALEHAHVLAEPDIRAYRNGGDGEGPRIGICGGMARSVFSMSRVANEHLGGEEAPIADGDLISSSDVDIVANMAAFAEDYLFRAVGLLSE